MQGMGGGSSGQSTSLHRLPFSLKLVMGMVQFLWLVAAARAACQGVTLPSILSLRLWYALKHQLNNLSITP